MSLLNTEAQHVVEGLIQLVAHLFDFQLLLQQVLLGLQQSLAEFSKSINIKENLSTLSVYLSESLECCFMGPRN
jgi:hypothetical protein